MPEPCTTDRVRRWDRRARNLAGAFLGSAVFALAGLAGCSHEEPPARPNVLLILSDTTRADRIGCYGNERGLTPAIDGLAADGVRFDAAYSHAPWTLPSTASLLTSLHPTEHGAGGKVPEFTGLDAGVETVVEVFRDAGWRTGAVVNVDFLASSFGLAQGFEWVDEQWFPSNSKVRRATPTTDAAIEWLSAREGEPFFLLVHYFDPHAVYDPPVDYRRRFASPEDRETEEFVFGTRRDMMALRQGQLELDAGTIARAASLYDGEVAYTDAEIGRLLEHLGRSGRDEETIVVFTADHGEEFLDHGGFEHGHSMFDELLRVPLIARWPDGPRGRVVEEIVRHIDVAPTLCRLAGLPVPDSFAGASLLEVRGDRPVLAHGNFWGEPRTALVSGGYKLIVDAQQRGALFDLSADPRERKNLVLEEPDVVQRMQGELRDMETRLRAAAAGERVELTPEVEEMMRSIGYLGDEDAAAPREGDRGVSSGADE